MKAVPTPRALTERQRTHQAIAWIIKAAEKGRRAGLRRHERIAREVLAILEGNSDVFKWLEEKHKAATLARWVARGLVCAWAATDGQVERHVPVGSCLLGIRSLTCIFIIVLACLRHNRHERKARCDAKECNRGLLFSSPNARGPAVVGPWLIGLRLHAVMVHSDTHNKSDRRNTLQYASQPNHPAAASWLLLIPFVTSIIRVLLIPSIPVLPGHQPNYLCRNDDPAHHL